MKNIEDQKNKLSQLSKLFENFDFQLLNDQNQRNKLSEDDTQKKPKKPVKTTDQESEKYFSNLKKDFDDDSSNGDLIAYQEPNDQEENSQENNDETPQDPRKKSSHSNTLKKTSGIIPNDQMNDLLSNLNIDDSNFEDDGYPEPEKTQELTIKVTTENLPMIVGQHLEELSSVDPDFHQVSALPGNMQRPIRMLGNHLFKEFTKTPTDDIYVVANLMSQGPNSEKEVLGVANYIKHNGKRLMTGTIDFSETMPGYKASVSVYSVKGIDWMVVKDDFGRYIYSWPSDSTSITSKAKKMLK